MLNNFVLVSFLSCCFCRLSTSLSNSFFNVWFNNVKLSWNVPRGTRTYLLQQVLAPGLISAKTEVLARFVTFFRSLRLAPSHEVRTVSLLAARDLRTVTGRNVSQVQRVSVEDPWTVSTPRVKESLRKSEEVLPESMDTWRCSYLISFSSA